MKKALTGILLSAQLLINCATMSAQQIPFLTELLSRDEDFVRMYAAKKKAGANLTAVESARKRADDAFRRGSIPDILEALSEGQILLSGKKWDERQKFVASLTLEVDRLVIEPNQVIQVSLSRMFPSVIEKAFSSPPTVTFSIVPSEPAPKPADAPQGQSLTPAIVIAERLGIGEASSNASRKLLLADGLYQMVASIESGNQRVAELRRNVFAISDFSDSISQMGKTIESIKTSTTPRVQSAARMLPTAEFQLQRLAQLNKSRGETELNPNQEIDRLESVLSSLVRGRNPLTRERGEVERAYQNSDGKLVPYRVYVPKIYDPANPTTLVVLLHGALGDERSYFGGLYDPAVIKGEADRRGWILLAVNGLSRFSSYTGAAQTDVFDAIAATTHEYKIDPAKIFLTGHSAGGLGV